MVCKFCGSEKVEIQMIQTGMKNKNKGVGFGGHLNNAARKATAISTLGISNLFWKKSKGTEKAKFQNEKIAVCQNCGESWTL